MQTQMEDEYPEVVNLKKMGEGLVKILGDESEASAHVNEQVKDFMECWNNLGNDIREKIRKVCQYCVFFVTSSLATLKFPFFVYALHAVFFAQLESSERQLSTMHRYMDNTQDWMDSVTEILDQYAANERRLQGLPVEDKPKDSESEEKDFEDVTEVSEGKPKESEDEPKESEDEPKESEDEPKVSEEKADTSEVEPEIVELDEDEKEKLQEEKKNLVKEFVVSVLTAS